MECYKCSVLDLKFPNQPQLPCSEFEDTHKFKVNCRFSTMCVKKILRYKLLDGHEVETFVRDCADQSDAYGVK